MKSKAVKTIRGADHFIANKNSDVCKEFESILNAINDIDKAIVYFDTKAARIRGNTTLLQSNNDLIKEQVSKLEKEVADIVTLEIKENGAKSRAEGLKLAITMNNMNLISQNNQALIQNMLQAAQGPGDAMGIFGLMGY